MCQAFEAEQEGLIASDIRKIKEKWRKHQSGEAPLTDEEIKKLSIELLMLSGY